MIAFLPHPQNLTYLDGRNELSDDLLILLNGSRPSEMWPIAQQLQRTLSEMGGVEWSVVAGMSIP